MASKQLGKLRQLVGEVISTRDKTIQSDEFRELEHDIELRRQGLWRLDVASDDFRHYLQKKKLSEVVEHADKLLAIDALGVVMIKHGEEFGEDSAYGQSLVNFGRAHCTIASIQESFAMMFEETYITTIRQSEDEIKEYQAQRKKLESRRLSFDAAAAKLDKLKHAKKVQEKDLQEAEDEYDDAKARYEETLEDVRARMWAIQENEVVQLRELTNFLDLELSFIRSYYEELQKVRDNWIDEETLKKLGAPKARPPSRPASASRANSIRSTKSAKKAAEHDSPDSSDEDVTVSRKKSLSRRKSEAGSKPPSRPQSRASRKRSDSTATATSEKEKEKEAKPEKTSHRLSVAGWASSAMSSVTGRGKKDKDKDKFSALRDEDGSDKSDTDDFGMPKASKSHSRKSSLPVPGLPSTSPKLPMRMMKSLSRSGSDKDKDVKDTGDKQGRKRVVALHDFAAASADELSFKAGEQIDVVSEVIDGWWMGELGGKRGLFPTTYTEVINSSSSSLPQKPPLPQRPPSSLTRSLGLQNGGSRTGSSLSSLEDGGHPFGDHNSHDGSTRPPYEESIQSSHMTESDDDESGSLMRVQRVEDGFSSRYISATPPPVPVPTPARRGTDAVSSSPVKKAPPPPPPRRSTLTASPAVTPPSLPSRPATLRSKSSHSSSGSLSVLANTGVVAAAASDELTYSPFDSPKDARFGCSEFKQNPFKPKGFCNNCFQMHSS
ncbi:BAR-domain-containing protein [Cubamyces sp. BRFM 1775]|nr:BAR-domain-containing protein [Cubamyces sp. BRFM 1775]